MEKINNAESLRQRVSLLEQRCAAEEISLKEQFRKVQDSLRPSRLIISTIKDLGSSSELKGGLLDIAMSWGAGSLSKRIVSGASGGFVRQALGALAETLVTIGVSGNAESIRSMIGNLIGKFAGKNKDQTPNEENKTNEQRN